jgi:hypothetical protein
LLEGVDNAVQTDAVVEDADSAANYQLATAPRLPSETESRREVAVRGVPLDGVPVASLTDAVG